MPSEELKIFLFQVWHVTWNLESDDALSEIIFFILAHSLHLPSHVQSFEIKY